MTFYIELSSSLVFIWRDSSQFCMARYALLESVGIRKYEWARIISRMKTSDGDDFFDSFKVDLN